MKSRERQHVVEERGGALRFIRRAIGRGRIGSQRTSEWANELIQTQKTIVEWSRINRERGRRSHEGECDAEREVIEVRITGHLDGP